MTDHMEPCLLRVQRLDGDGKPQGEAFVSAALVQFNCEPFDDGSECDRLLPVVGRVSMTLQADPPPSWRWLRKRRWKQLMRAFHGR